MPIKVDSFYVCLVDVNGKETERIPWMNLVFDYRRMGVFGSDVCFTPPVGGYCGYRIYRHDGELHTGQPFGEIVYVEENVSGWPNTITINDLHFAIRPTEDKSMLLINQQMERDRYQDMKVNGKDPLK